MYVPRLIAARREFEPPALFPPSARGVGHNEQSIAWVWGTHRARADNRPFRIEPEFGKIPENLLKSTGAKGTDVLDDRELRFEFAAETAKMLPQSAALSGDAFTFACLANVLAWESTADDID
jgi:hypothetical protein